MNELKEQINARDKEKVDEIIKDCERYRQKLIEHCQLHFDYDYENACDCVQNAYLALYENLMRGIEIKNYRAWLYKVTMNYRNKAIREKVKQNEYSFANSEEKDQALENSIVYNPDYLGNIVSDLEIERRYIKIISSLSEDKKDLYVDHYLKKQTFAEIGARMGIKPSTIERRHAKLKKKIIKMVKSIELN